MTIENLEKPKVEEKPVKVLDEWFFGMKMTLAGCG
jgi:hypothetical protein